MHVPQGRSAAFAVLIAVGCANRRPVAAPSVTAPPGAALAAPTPAPVSAPPAAVLAPSRARPDVTAAAAAPRDVPTAASAAPQTEAVVNEDTNDARGWLGVELEAAAPAEAGVRIGRVVPKSPAEAAGILAGDLVMRIDDQPVASPSDVIGIVSGQHAGARLGLALKRRGADRLVAVILGALPERDEIYRMTFVDQPAPPFDALKIANGSFKPTLQAQRGQVLVVEFWAPWCVACRALVPHMNQWHDRYSARGLRMIAITADPADQAAATASELGMKYPVASDESGKTVSAYQAMAIPAVFVIDRRGTVRDVMVGYDAVHLPKLDALVERLIAER